MRPCGPTTKGNDSAFQFLSASGASCDAASGWSARQFLPSSVETSVPLGPTVIQVFAVCGRTLRQNGSRAAAFALGHNRNERRLSALSQSVTAVPSVASVIL